MENDKKLYPILKNAKTCFGRPIPEHDRDKKGMLMAYCPICNGRLWLKKVHPRLGEPWSYDRKKAKTKNPDGLVGKPIHCEKCGVLIHPLS